MSRAMVKGSLVKGFNPASLSRDRLQRLDNLLDVLDAAAEGRKKCLIIGRTMALIEFFKDPCAKDIAYDTMPIFDAVPQDRWPAFVEEISGDFSVMPSSAETVFQLKTVDALMQKKALSFMFSQCAQYVDVSEDRKYWQKVSGLYRAILSQYSDILSNEDDQCGAEKLGHILSKERGNISAVWKMGNEAEKILKARSLLAQSYPNDDTDKLHFAVVDVPGMLGSYVTCLSADTMILSDTVFKDQNCALLLYLLAHEFQHRRQLRLVDRLERNQLAKGSAEYYQARLFRANCDGGYLAVMFASNQLERYARFADYYMQPVEQHANGYARLSNTIGETGGDKIWNSMEGTSRILSYVARQADNIVSAFSKMTRPRDSRPSR